MRLGRAAGCGLGWGERKRQEKAGGEAVGLQGLDWVKGKVGMEESLLPTGFKLQVKESVVIVGSKR